MTGIALSHRSAAHLSEAAVKNILRWLSTLLLRELYHTYQQLSATDALFRKESGNAGYRAGRVKKKTQALGEIDFSSLFSPFCVDGGFDCQ